MTAVNDVLRNDASSAQSSLKREVSDSERSLGPANNKSHVMSLLANIPDPIVDLKRDDVVIKEIFGSSIELISAAK